MAKKFSRGLSILAILIIGILVGYFFPSLLSEIQRGQITENVKRLYELANPGVMVSVESVKDMGNLYKILLKVVSNTGTNYIETYVTKDGKYLTQTLIFVEESIKSISSLKSFVECLNSKGVKIYGITNSSQSPQGASATLLQLNILGRYSSQIYVPCDGPYVQNCIDANVNQVPSVVYEGNVYPGVKTIEWFEQLTGCKLQ
ncbi:MAG: hypothetical protein J7L39_01945 [Candidatus Aenigmarchaeota archaeon]|nr:hypothetical protein [Candidatus Aenigmarchaeota archaeon]